MGLGMGTVFLFLIVMIGSMNCMSFIIDKFFPEVESEPAPAVAQQDNKKTIAAITAAVKHHREG